MELRGGYNCAELLPISLDQTLYEATYDLIEVPKVSKFAMK